MSNWIKARFIYADLQAPEFRWSTTDFHLENEKKKKKEQMFRTVIPTGPNPIRWHRGHKQINAIQLDENLMKYHCGHQRIKNDFLLSFSRYLF